MAMTKDKQIRLGVMIGIAVVLVITMIIGIVGFVNYHHTYISIGGMDYRRDAGCLDLSGRSIDGVEKLKNLFRGNKSRSEIVATFLAVLEMCKVGSVTLEDDVSGENPSVRVLDAEIPEKEET